MMYLFLCKNVILCTDGGGGTHKQDLLLSRDGLEDLQFGFHVFTDTKVHQSVKPAKERVDHSTEMESGDCHVLTCLV